MEMGRTATDFSGPIQHFQYSHDIRGHRFRMQFIQCNNRLDVVATTVVATCFLLGKDYEDHGTIVFMSDGGKCNNTVIEYGHFRLKIASISILTLSQRQSSPCSELLL